MVPVVKRKKVYVKKRKRKVLICDRTEVKFNYMKYYRVVRYWAMRTYDITTPELEMLFFLYDEKLFTISKFDKYDNIFSWNTRRLYKLQNKKLVHVWRPAGHHEARLYELTYKAKRMIFSIYKKLNGEEPIPTSERRNPIFRKNASYTDKVYAMAIKDFNNEIKESKPRLYT